MAQTISKISITWNEDIVSRPERGDFYWRLTPFISRRDYKANDLLNPVVKKMRGQLKEIKAKRGY